MEKVKGFKIWHKRAEGENSNISLAVPRLSYW